MRKDLFEDKIGENIMDGLRITYLLGRCAIEMSNGEIGLKRFLDKDEIEATIEELEYIKHSMETIDPNPSSGDWDDLDDTQI